MTYLLNKSCDQYNGFVRLQRYVTELLVTQSVETNLAEGLQVEAIGQVVQVDNPGVGRVGELQHGERAVQRRVRASVELQRSQGDVG